MEVNEELPIVHMYWDQGFDKAPELVKRILLIWKRVLPAEKLKTYDAKDAEAALHGMDIAVLSIAHKSDMFRLFLLEKFGGVWIDATVMPGPSIRNWLKSIRENEVFMFQKPGKDRVISNWLIASEKGGVIVSSWKQEMYRLFSCPGTKIVSDASIIKKALVYGLIKLDPTWVSYRSFVKLTKVYPYFISHYTFARLVKSEEAIKAKFMAVPYCSASVPHALQRHVKKNENLSKEEIEEIYVKSPVHKLDWKSADLFCDVVSVVESIVDKNNVGVW